jgi:predicted kinase
VTDKEFIGRGTKVTYTDRRPIVVCIVGNIGAGKSTFARYLARELSADLISSDSIRVELFGDAGKINTGARVFDTMRERQRFATQNNRNVVLDSTGMSVRYRDHIQQLQDIGKDSMAPYRVFTLAFVCSRGIWFEREQTRTDRTNGPLKAHVYEKSCEDARRVNPDITIETDPWGRPLEVLQDFFADKGIRLDTAAC